MPICIKCERMLPTSEVRRRRPPYEGQWQCKDKFTCKRVVKEKKQK